MEIAKTIPQIRTLVDEKRKAGKSIGFVPTMGALHQGHAALIKTAAAKCDEVVVSVFVNPTQFGPNEDFEAYPRTLEADIEKAKEAGARIIFCPERSEVYGGKSFIQFEITELGNRLCGASRPGHFNGVVQIVNKLFNIVRPDVAIFGQKDIQQFRILEQMTAEFNHNIEIVMGETVRAADGLALSSRNTYLSTEERITAPALFGFLQQAGREITGLALQHIANPREKLSTEIREICTKAEKRLNENGFTADYVEAVNYHDLQSVTTINSGDRIVVAAAAKLGKTRLIDNLVLTV